MSLPASPEPTLDGEGGDTGEASEKTISDGGSEVMDLSCASEHAATKIMATKIR